MTGADPNNARDRLAAATARTALCIPLERLGEDLTEDERRHVAECARCETELRLWREFHDPSPGDDERAVRWVAAEIARRRATPASTASRPFWSPGMFRLPAFAAAAAALLLVATLGYLALDREPGISAPPAGADGYRSAGVQVVGPVGTVPAAPTRLEWKAVEGAARYDVSVLEVDRTVLWRTSCDEPSATLPDRVVAQFVPGKTVLWEVTARDRGGATVALSGMQQFRVAYAK